MRSATDLLSEAVRGAVHAPDVDGALAWLAHVLGRQFSLWRASLILFRPGETVHIAALWSAGETVLPTGMDISMGLTPALRQNADLLRAGKTVTVRFAEVDYGLLGDVIKEESLKSWIGIPIRDGDDVVGALSLSSLSNDAFDHADLLFFEGLARGIESHLVALLGPAAAVIRESR